MPMTPAAAKKYKPRREPGSLDDVVYSDTKKAAMEEAKAMKDTEDATAAYNKSLTTEGKKKGGMTASSRADGIAQRGKTRGTIVMCGGGMYKK